MEDIDGNVYKSIHWIADNLRVTRYNDSEPIPAVFDDSEWEPLQVLTRLLT